ncbi:MAG: hypothetical protein OEL55_02725 [Desulfobulbaceae bacterium]|nr:hypothetical protein [Desulfobulbaceae bacterium]
MEDLDYEDKLETMISGFEIHRFKTIAGFLKSCADGEITFAENGAKVILTGIFELVHRDDSWYLRRFKSAYAKVEVEVEYEEFLVGEAKEHCQTIWNPSLLSQEGDKIFMLLDHTSKEEKIKEKENAKTGVMESLAYI